MDHFGMLQCGWLAKSGYSVGYSGETKSGYGNYANEDIKVNYEKTTIVVKQSGKEQKLLTGQTSYTKSNNIYDLSGNFYEWTQEVYDTYLRILRRKCLSYRKCC